MFKVKLNSNTKIRVFVYDTIQENCELMFLIYENGNWIWVHAYKYSPLKPSKQRNPAKVKAEKIQGMCTLCGVNPPKEGKKRCAECAEKQRKYQADHRAGK